MDKANQYLAQRIGADAMAIADLIQQGEAKDRRIAELEAKIAALSASTTSVPARI